MIGQSIGNYKILEQVDGSKTFFVYKAVDMLLNRNVYIKVSLREVINQPDIAERFRFEAATLAKLVHPNIPILHSLTTAEDELFMITEFLDGESLAKVLQRQGKLSFNDSVAIFTQVLDCLEFAHSAGIVHGDLKTDKIFLTKNGIVKVLGFGTSNNFPSKETKQNNQELENQEEAGKDIYAVVRIMFEALTGKNLSADNIIYTEQLLRVVDPVVPGKILDTVINIIRLQMYGKFQSAAQLKRELLPYNLKNRDVLTNSAAVINTEFLGRAGNNNAAEYSIDFTQDKNSFFRKAFKRNLAKDSNNHATSISTLVNWKLAQKNILVGGAGILAIFALHFFFQFTFINSDSSQMVKDLNNTEQIIQAEPFAETEQVEKVETFPEIDPFVKKADEIAEVSETYEVKAERPKKTEVVKKPERASQPVYVRPKTAPPRNVIRNKDPRETRAERLRRAEKLLTGA